MLTLYDLLNPMDLDSELEVFYEGLEDKPIISGRRGVIDLPDNLFDAEVLKFIPGIITMIYIKMLGY